MPSFRSIYSNQKKPFCQENPAHFLIGFTYTAMYHFLREDTYMFESNDPHADLEDLLYYPGDGNPSER